MDSAEEALRKLQLARDYRSAHSCCIPTEMPKDAPSIPEGRRLSSRNYSDLPLTAFLNEHLAAHAPVVIRGYLEHCKWNALQRWPDMSFWRSAYGHRLVCSTPAPPLHFRVCRNSFDFGP